MDSVPYVTILMFGANDDINRSIGCLINVSMELWTFTRRLMNVTDVCG